MDKSAIKSISKSEMADIIGVSKATLRRYLNHDLFDRIQPLGYKKHSHILTGTVAEFVCSHYCIVFEKK